jgi:translation initiation factor 6 (eIF-6)
VAYGTPYIKAGVIVNDKGIIISESSTGPELGRADEVFNPER